MAFEKRKSYKVCISLDNRVEQIGISDTSQARKIASFNFTERTMPKFMLYREHAVDSRRFGDYWADNRRVLFVLCYIA